jgi:glucose/arabinose dehydrogenase
MQTSALTEDWPATEAPAVTTSPAFPVSIPTDKTPTDEPKTFSPTVTPTIPHLANYEYELELAADDFRQPLYLTHAGDGSGRLFVVEQGGVIWIVQDGNTLSPPFLDLSARVSHRASEQGLLGLAFHPDYGRNGYFFAHYSDRNGDTVVQRFSVSADPNRAELSSAVIVLTHPQPYGNHNGGQISFGPDGHLYVGLGDGGLASDPHDNGQNLLTWLGAILRVDVDQNLGFAVPPDNPFLSSGDAAPEIWVYGLRNPWRFSFDRMTGDLYIGDVGQNDWEEIDYRPAGSTAAENYGWGRMEGDHCYQWGCDSELYVAPIMEYHHSDGGCSVTGGYVYRGGNLKGLQGVYVYGDYCSGLIWALFHTAPDEWTNTPLIESGLKISSFGEDESGEVYVVDHAGGIYRLKHALEP